MKPMTKKNKEYIKHVMKRDKLTWTQARRVAMFEIRTGKALGHAKIKALGEALDDMDKLDSVIEIMEGDDDEGT